jgi:hypothetical protein
LANRDLAVWTPDESDWFHAPQDSLLSERDAARKLAGRSPEIRVGIVRGSEPGSINRRRWQPLTILTQNDMIDGMKIELL